MKTKDKIVLISVDLFNKSGVVAVTTNHIAKELNISPGNLYFHFQNKEEIIRQIFKMMCKETYEVWHTKKGKKLLHPLELIERNYELFWKYRFFHREMYYLRRKDSQLAKLWKAHIIKVQKLMILMYKRWVKQGWMRAVQSQEETEFMSTVLLVTASNFLQFFESAERVPAKKHIETGKRYVSWLLMPWTIDQMHQDFQSFVFQKPNL